MFVVMHPRSNRLHLVSIINKVRVDSTTEKQIGISLVVKPSENLSRIFVDVVSTLRKLLVSQLPVRLMF